jgi:hypothetical protein
MLPPFTSKQTALVADLPVIAIECMRERTRGRCANERDKFAPHSLDHLVSKHEQIMRDGKPKRIGCLEVDNELVFDRLLDRQIG